MTILARLFVVLTLATLQAACGSSPPVRYYALDSLESGYGTSEVGTPQFGVGPLRMPDYLTRTKIVTRGEASEVRIDDYHRWIEPVDEAVHRIVAANLDAMLDDVVAISFPYRFLAKDEYKIIGRIERFDADGSGRVQLIVQWGIATADADQVTPPQRQIYSTQVANPGDYNAIAAAMSEVLLQFSRDIAAAHRSIDDG